MWEIELLARYLEGEPFRIVLEHSRHVADLALEVADRLAVSGSDRTFIEEAALLHDIGVCQVHAPELGLHGGNPYIMHGVLGRAILESEGYPLHGLVCERHTGVGLTCDDIVRRVCRFRIGKCVRSRFPNRSSVLPICSTRRIRAVWISEKPPNR